jgi:ribonuclease Z
MPNFHVTILGSSAAKPAFGRNQTAQVVNHHDRLFLLDCGEGTQMQFSKYKIRSGKLGHIFISHLHGDHWFGLAGLLSSLSMAGRTEPLLLFAPAAALEILTLQFKYSHTVLQYAVEFKALESFATQNLGQPPVIWEDEVLQVSIVPMQHSIACWGFCFEEKPYKRKIIKEKLPKELPFPLIVRLKNGEDVTFEGQYLANEDYTTFGHLPKKYFFCSDTVYDERLLPFIHEADLLYHEATYAHNLVQTATDRMHSTAHQAALLAAKGKVKNLLIGHFSSRYRELDALLAEAQAVFPATALALEGLVFEV